MELQGFDTLEASRALESAGMETEHWNPHQLKRAF